ncbi:isochorismate synthase MenF [Pseudoalteromonas xiamenensis]|jgi:isochorismate synthase|uniref:isochorismate synthase n=1 Tax=Pseudoalteromonas xiamenensis TaxID=882626 RepID=UPI0035EAE17D
MLSELDALTDLAAPERPFDPQQHALFVSGQRCYLAQHPHHRFTSPIDNHEALVNTLETELAKCPSEDAVVFGVLPFCKSEQAQFLVSDHVQTLDKSHFTAYLASQNKLDGARFPELDNVHHRQSQTQYEHAILRAKALFEREELEKIVLGKQVDLYFDDALPKGQVLANLLQQSASGFPFSFPTESGATLLGVSPELLLKKSHRAIFSNPLAGSAKRTSDPAVDVQRQRTLMNSKKDRFEHAVVLVEMSQVLEPWCHQLHIPSVPSLLSTATMWHLSTEVEGQLHTPATHVLALANRLHPTPALCGKPTQHAYPWIKALEGESRHFFSGIVGWCDKHGNGEWVVVIRSSEINGRHARLFAGAGIVHASNPTAEWLETEAKLSTMLNALHATTAYRQVTQESLLETA